MKEILGRDMQVIASPNPTEVGIKGTVTQDSRSSLLIGGKRVLKASRTFLIDGKETKGETIIGKYEERNKGK